MRAGDAAVQAEALRLEGQRLDVPREGIVALVAMQIDAQAARSRDLAQCLHGGRAIGHGALEMRDAADDADALVERAGEIAGRRRRAQIAVLRKCHQFEIEIGGDLLLDVEQGIDGEQPVIADVDMAAHREHALRHREIAIFQRALDERFIGQ